MLWIQLDGEGPLHRQLYRALRGRDPDRAARRRRTPARQPPARPRAGHLAQHGAPGLRAAPGRGIRDRSRALGDLRRRGAAGRRGRAARSERGRQAGSASEPTLSALGRRLALAVAPGRASWSPWHEPAPLRLPLRRALLLRSSDGDLVAHPGPPRAAALGPAARLSAARRSGGAARSARGLPGPRARSGLRARADRDRARLAAGDRSHGAPADRPGRSRRAGGAALHGLLVLPERGGSQALARRRGRAGPAHGRARRDPATRGSPVSRRRTSIRRARCSRCRGGSRCSNGRRAATPTCSRTTTTASSASTASRSSVCKPWTATAGFSTRARLRSCCSRRCGSAGWSRRRPLAPFFLNAKALADTGTPSLEQLALADFIREGHLERHARRARIRTAARRVALLEAVSSELGERARVLGASAGLHVLLAAPAALRARDAAAAQRLSRARRRGLPGRAVLRAAARPRRAAAGLRGPQRGVDPRRRRTAPRGARLALAVLRVRRGHSPPPPPLACGSLRASLASGYGAGTAGASASARLRLAARFACGQAALTSFISMTAARFTRIRMLLLWGSIGSMKKYGATGG